MKRRVAFAVFAATGMIAVALPAIAEGRCGRGDRMLQRADLNGDGETTPTEADAVRAVRFLRLDADGDGGVTEEEMLVSAQERIARRIGNKFARMDRNGDGRVERAEFDAEFGSRSAAQFVRLDSDGDGRVLCGKIRTRPNGGPRGWHNDRHPDE